jgi:hypothetical protein
MIEALNDFLQVYGHGEIGEPQFGLFFVLHPRVVQKMHFKLTFVKRKISPAFPEIFRGFSFRFCADQPLHHVALNDISCKFFVNYLPVAILYETYEDLLAEAILN